MRGSKPSFQSPRRRRPRTLLFTRDKQCIGVAKGLSLCLAALGVQIAPAAAREAPHVQISIAARPLGAALIDLAVQANISISTPPGGFANAHAAALHGDLSAEEALRQLLTGTGFTFERVDAVTFRIVPVPAPHDVRQAQSTEETIIVTARRRFESLDRAPASATSIAGDRLVQLGARESEDMALVASGLSFTNLGPGRDKIFMRGLSDGAFSGRTESTVSMYLDESRITYGAPNPDLALTDVSAVEILRGPQGALYGGGAIGGVYRIITNPPDFDHLSGSLSSDGEFTTGSLGGAVRGVLNLPLVPERSAARFVVYGDRTAGWLDNSLLNLSDTNGTERKGARLTLATRIDDGWTMTESAVYQSIDSRDSQYVTSGGEDRETNVLEPHDNDFLLTSATIRGPTSLGEFDSTTTFIRHGLDSRYDATGAFTQFGAPPASVSAFDQSDDVKFEVEEARLSGVASPFPWSLGVFLAFGQTRETNLLTYDLQATPQTGYLADRRDAIRELALYGDVGWRINSRLTLNLGARAFRSDLGTRASANGIDPGLSDHFSAHRHEVGVAPQVQLAYQANPNALYYAEVSEGYRGGGFNTGAMAAFSSSAQEPVRRYGADRLWNAELGVKYRLLDERLRFRATAFWQEWDDVQSDQLIAASLPFTGNVGNAENFGVETEATFDLSRRTQITAHATYADPEIVKPDNRFPVTADAGLPGAPRVLAGVSFTTHRDWGAIGEFNFSFDALYVGRSEITFISSNGLNIGDYVTANLRTGLMRGAWEADFYVDNITDNDALTFSFGNPFRFGNADAVTPSRPRTIGIEVQRTF